MMRREELLMLKNARNFVAKIPGELRELRTGVAEQQAQIAVEMLDALIDIQQEKLDAEGTTKK